MPDFKIYQSAEFLRILEDVYQIEKVGVFEDETLACLTTFYRSKKKKGDIFNMPFNFYHSPDIPPEREAEYFDTIKQYSRDTGKNISIRSFHDYQGVPKKLYANNPVMDLKQGAGYSKNLKQNINRNNNKCERFGISLAKATSLQDVSDFYKNVLSVAYIDKHKMVFQPLSLYMELFRQGLIEMFVARRGGKILGGIVCIKDGDTLHYNWGASLNYENIAIGTALINHAVEYAKSNGYHYFDLGSTSLSDDDLYNFKMKWGAENHPVYEYYTLKEPHQIDLNSSYKFARNVYSCFPKPFLRWLMPKIIPWLVQ